jgi:hypothetical protein
MKEQCTGGDRTSKISLQRLASEPVRDHPKPL